MKRIRDLYWNMPLRNKLRFSYVLLILIPLTLLCIIYYLTASQNILDVAKKNILDVTVKNMQVIDGQLEAIENGAVNLNVDPDLFEILKNLDRYQDSEILSADRRIKTVLPKYVSGDGVVSVNIITPRYVFGETSQFIIPAENFYGSGIYEKIQGNKGAFRWFPTYQAEKEFDMDFPNQDQTVFSLVQELNPVWIDPVRPNDVEYLEEDSNAVLIINCDESLMDRMFSGSNSIDGSFYCVSSPDGVIVSHSQKEKNGTVEMVPWLEEASQNKSGSLVLPYEGTNVVVCYVVSGVTGWVAASVTPVNSLLNQVSKLQVMTILVWVLLFALAMFLSRLFSGRITRPVNQLVEAMRQTGTGDFSVRLSVHGKDEMWYLTEKYNEMGEKIQTLVEQNYKSELRKKEAEIMALNLQLNPHFLYNTLNIANMMALEEGNVEVSKVLISLSDMLQYTFRNQQELVPFSEEFVWLQNYLHIMGIRFEGKFTVRYEIDKTVFQYSIPKLLLQPLVENAILHGFRDTKQGGILWIRAKQEGNTFHLEVEDNGRGMNEEELDRARHMDRKRIGLNNAEQRIQLIYGEQGEMHILTAPGRGTRIVVVLPCRN